jgi:hypothetical protein
MWFKFTILLLTQDFIMDAILMLQRISGDIPIEAENKVNKPHFPKNGQVWQLQRARICCRDQNKVS